MQVTIPDPDVNWFISTDYIFERYLLFLSIIYATEYMLPFLQLIMFCISGVSGHEDEELGEEPHHPDDCHCS
jgi:hypothetical protein